MPTSIIQSSQMFLVLVALFIGLKANADCNQTKAQDTYGNSTTEYHSDKTSDRAALILPPLGGENVADQKLAEGLCKRGLTAVILNYIQTRPVADDLSCHDKATKATLLSIDQFLSTRKESNWGIVGASLGSLNASIAFGIGQGISSPDAYPNLMKLHAAVLTVSGGSLAEILATSQLSSATSDRNAAIAALHLSSPENFQKELLTAIHYDTITYAQPQAHNKVLMFSSSTDTSVPASTQENLWQAWGQPKRVMFKSDHFVTIARVYFFYVSEISDFLNERLNTNMSAR